MHPRPPIWRPFRSFPIWKSTIARFSNRSCTCTLPYGGLFAYFLFENRPLIDFQIGNEHVCRHGAHCLLETRLLIDLQIGSEYVCRPGAHCFLEKRSLVDFLIGNKREGRNGRDPGVRDRILSAQRNPLSCNVIFDKKLNIKPVPLTKSVLALKFRFLSGTFTFIL